MKLRCRSCGTRFTVDDGGDRPRCPNCLRTLGLEPDEPVVEEKAAGSSGERGRWLGIGLGLGALALAGVVAALLLAQRGPLASGVEPHAAEELSAEEQARRTGQARRLAAEARELLQEGKLRQANAAADRAWRLAPVEGEVRQIRGEIYRASGALREATTELVAALSAKETVQRHVLAGETLAAQGEVARAEQHFERARELQPAAPAPVAALAVLYRTTGRETELTELRSELAPDGGTSAQLEAVDQALARLEEMQAKAMAQIRQKLAEADGPGAAGESSAAGADGGEAAGAEKGSAAGGPGEAGEHPAADAAGAGGVSSEAPRAVPRPAGPQTQ